MVGLLLCSKRVQSLFDGRFAQARDTQNAREDQAACIGTEPGDNLAVPTYGTSRVARPAWQR